MVFHQHKKKSFVTGNGTGLENRIKHFGRISARVIDTKKGRGRGKQVW
jgi:hypothetical protein